MTIMVNNNKKKTERNLSPTIEKNQKPNTSHVASHRVLFWAPYLLLPI